MTVVSQTFLKPATYRIGRRRLKLTADDLKRYAEGTTKALKSKLHIPFFGKHTPPADPAFGPQAKRDAVKDVAGWLKGIKVNDDGSLAYTAEVTNPEYAKAIKDGTVKFASPEIPLRDYVDGLGRNFGRLFRNFAFVPNPRNPDQSPLAIQFSLDDVVDFAEDEEDGEDKESSLEDFEKIDEAAAGDGGASDISETNPDVPAVDDPKDLQINEAIIANLASLGVELPAECDPFSKEGRLALLAALKTAAAAKASADAEAAAAAADDGTPEVQEVAPDNSMQFDEDNPQVAALLATVKSQREKLAAAARGDLVSKAKSIPVPSIRKRIVEAVETVQFADDGSEVPTFTVDQIAAMFEGFPKHLAFDEESLAEPPPGDIIDPNEELENETEEQAAAAADAQLSRVGFRQREAFKWENSSSRQGPRVGGEPTGDRMLDEVGSVVGVK